MTTLGYLFIGLFLPLFPFSMGFNALFARSRNAMLRSALLLIWPQIGLALMSTLSGPPPQGLLAWALFTSFLYALRALALREVGQWTGFLATSLWALLWMTNTGDPQGIPASVHALGFSIPLVLLALLTAGLEQRFGAAYTGLYGGLAQTLPRFSGVLVMVILAAVAAPLFPAFFTLLGMIVDATAGMPVAALVMLGIWLLWSWAGVRLLQGLVVGPVNRHEAGDLTAGTSWAYALTLTLLLVGGIYFTGGLA